MPARAPCEKLITARRSPRGLLEMLTAPGAPMPRTTSHSVWPSATVPVATGAGSAAPSDNALAFVGIFADAIPGQAPSALTRSSAVTGLSGVSGGLSIETFLMKRRPLRENHSASFDMRSGAKISEAVAPQPANTGASRSNAGTDFQWRYLFRTMNQTHPSP